MPLWQRRETSKHDSEVAASGSDTHTEFISDGDLKYAFEQGYNDSSPSYQEASGAPVESKSPLGYNVGPIAILFLNFSKMVGTGVYSTPSSVLSNTGSVGLALIYWALGFLISIAALAM
jgi:hypothetical protein